MKTETKIAEQHLLQSKKALEILEQNIRSKETNLLELAAKRRTLRSELSKQILSESELKRLETIEKSLKFHIASRQSLNDKVEQIFKDSEHFREDIFKESQKAQRYQKEAKNIVNNLKNGMEMCEADRIGFESCENEYRNIKSACEKGKYQVDCFAQVTRSELEKEKDTLTILENNINKNLIKTNAQIAKLTQKEEELVQSLTKLQQKHRELCNEIEASGVEIIEDFSKLRCQAKLNDWVEELIRMIQNEKHYPIPSSVKLKTDLKLFQENMNLLDDETFDALKRKIKILFEERQKNALEKLLNNTEKNDHTRIKIKETEFQIKTANKIIRVS